MPLRAHSRTQCSCTWRVKRQSKAHTKKQNKSLLCREAVPPSSCQLPVWVETRAHAVTHARAPAFYTQRRMTGEGGSWTHSSALPLAAYQTHRVPAIDISMTVQLLYWTERDLIEVEWQTESKYIEDEDCQLISFVTWLLVSGS